MIIRKDTTGIRDSPLGVPKMHSGASGFPLWSVGLSSMEHRAFLYGALVDAPQGVSRPPVRREISQWGQGPFGGTIEDNHFPKLQFYILCLEKADLLAWNQQEKRSPMKVLCCILSCRQEGEVKQQQSPSPKLCFFHT